MPQVLKCGESQASIPPITVQEVAERVDAGLSELIENISGYPDPKQVFAAWRDAIELRNQTRKDFESLMENSGINNLHPSIRANECQPN